MIQKNPKKIVAVMTPLSGIMNLVFFCSEAENSENASLFLLFRILCLIWPEFLRVQTIITRCKTPLRSPKKDGQANRENGRGAHFEKKKIEQMFELRFIKRRKFSPRFVIIGK